jgi:glycosyltransferase involved in cell wall biosynthesis
MKTDNKYSTAIIIVLLMRRQGDTGLQKHVNNYANYLQNSHLDLDTKVVNPFAAGIVAYPALGLHRFIHFLNPSWAVGWHHYVPYLILKPVLKRHVREALRRSDRVVVQAQDPWSAKAATEAKRSLYVRDQKRVRVVLTVHFNRSQAEEWANKGRIQRGDATYRLLQRTEQISLSNVDRLVFVSRAMQAYLEEQFPFISSIPSKVVPNGVIPNSGSQGVNCRYSGDLISIGRLERRKNQAFLLEVLRVCKEHGHSYRLTLIGDGEERERLEAQAKELGISDLISFAGYMPNAAACIARHRVYVHAALFESFGIVLLEALAQGVPVFAYPAGGVPEVFTDSMEGRYWDIEDSKGAASKLIEVLEDKQKYEELSRNARKRAAHFTIEKVFGDMLDFSTAGQSSSVMAAGSTEEKNQF